MLGHVHKADEATASEDLAVDGHMDVGRQAGTHHAENDEPDAAVDRRVETHLEPVVKLVEVDIH